MLVKTPTHPFIAPTTLKFIQPFLEIVGYQAIVDKVSAFFTKNLAQPWQTIKLIIADVMAKFESVPKRLEEEYHSIKDNTSLSIRITANRTPHLVDDVVQNKKRKRTAGETSSPKPSFNIRVRQQKPISTTIPPPSDDHKRDDIAKATLLSLALNKTAKIVEEQENIGRVKEKILEEDVEKIVEGDDEESYASEFADSVFLDEEDTGNRLEPESHKEIPEIVNDDDVNDNKDEKKDDDDADDENDNHDDNALEKMKEMSDTLNNLVPELSVAITNELIKEAVPRMVNDAVKKDK
ncbi:hypothetical protein Tco_1373725 [Tanacetum coccineum]